MKVPHLTVDAVCPRFSEKEIKQMLLDLCGVAEMHPISKPFTVNGAEYNPGVSGFIFIEFSNITIHTFERGNDTAINVDLFSCRKFDTRKVKRYLRGAGLSRLTSRIRWREIKL